MMAETRGSTPFRLDLHVGDVGHAFIVGPTGSGKSVLLSLLALQFRRFRGAQVVLFDRGRSARAATLAMGGESVELGLEGTLSLQPLARIDEPGEIAFALEWVMGLLANEGVAITQDVKDTVWTALKSLATASRAERTLIGLAVLMQSNALVAAALPARSHALTVFDPLNYQENLLSAVRALEQINNQVRLLQGQAQVLLKMDQNMLRLGPTLSPDLQRALADIQSRLRTGEGIALQLRATEAAYERLFPKQVSAALSTDDMLRGAKSRWDEEYAALRRAALLQGQIADGIETDTRLLGDAVARSRNAAGALEVAQAGNELTALSIKQALALQGLLAAQHRADTIAKAREFAAEEEARQRFKSFLGNGQAYTASR